MENFLGDWRTCDMSLIWYAHLEETKHLKLSRRRLEKGKAVVSKILNFIMCHHLCCHTVLLILYDVESQ